MKRTGSVVLFLISVLCIAPGAVQARPKLGKPESQEAQIARLVKSANATAAHMDRVLRPVKPLRKSILTGTDNGGELVIYQRGRYRRLEPGIGLSHWLYDWPIYLRDGKTVLVKRIKTTLNAEGTSIAKTEEARFYLLGDKLIYVPLATQPLKWQVLPPDSQERRDILANIHFAIRGAASRSQELEVDDKALHTP